LGNGISEGREQASVKCAEMVESLEDNMGQLLRSTRVDGVTRRFLKG
jgi:hypothetical protein